VCVSTWCIWKLHCSVLEHDALAQIDAEDGVTETMPPFIVHNSMMSLLVMSVLIQLWGFYGLPPFSDSHQIQIVKHYFECLSTLLLIAVLVVFRGDSATLAESLSVPAYNVGSEALSIVHGCPVFFPAPN
jgi:hypothetical protein